MANGLQKLLSRFGIVRVSPKSMREELAKRLRHLTLGHVEWPGVFYDTTNNKGEGMKKAILGTTFIWLLCASLLAHANWYSGGTLHRANALEWQQASQANKLATAADFVSSMHQNGHFKPVVSQRINGINSLRPLAQELVTQLDLSFTVDPDPDENRRMFTNVKVGDSAVVLMMVMGWIEQ